MSISIILIDDHSILRAGVRLILEPEPDIEVVGEGVSGFDAIRLVETLSPSVVVMDVEMPGMGGIEATSRLRDKGSSALVVALSMHREDSYVKKMLDAGGCGYVLKTCVAEELVLAIRTVVTGKPFIGSGLHPLED